jgi:hypothetical protein
MSTTQGLLCTAKQHLHGRAVTSHGSQQAGILNLPQRLFHYHSLTHCWLFLLLLNPLEQVPVAAAVPGEPGLLPAAGLQQHAGV